MNKSYSSREEEPVQDIEFTAYHKPTGKLSTATMFDVLEWRPNSFGDYGSSHELADTYLYRSHIPDEHAPDDYREWHDQITNWMPEEEFQWWLGQFNGPNLDPMPEAWWRTMSEAFIVARSNLCNVGAIALTNVMFGDRPRFNDGFRASNLIFHELRGLLVAPEYRKRGIGRLLVEAAVQEARNLHLAPTIAITSNPAAAQLFESTGAFQQEASAYELRYIHGMYTRVACWHHPEIVSPPTVTCSSCPHRERQFWWWDTHLPQSEAMT